MKNVRITVCDMCTETPETCSECKHRDVSCGQRVKKNHPKLDVCTVKTLISASYVAKCHLTYRVDSDKCKRCDLRDLCKASSAERKFIKRSWRARKDTRRRSPDTIKGGSKFSDPICEKECPFNDECDGMHCRLDLD